MTTTSPHQFDPGFETAENRFNQKDEMFKRARWDNSVLDIGRRFYDEIVISEKPGWGLAEFSALNSSWCLDGNFTSGIGLGNQGMYAWDGPSGRADALVLAAGRLQGTPPKLTRLVKSMALHLGASQVGICRLHSSWIYSHEYNRNTGEETEIRLPPGMKRALVIAVEMDYDQVRSQSLVLRGVATGQGYSKMAHLAHAVAVFIRGLGYRAAPSGNDTALSVPMAMAAGLGECSRMGLLITPQFGPRVRLCKVFTDMPLVPDFYRPFGVTEFCHTCRVCSQTCPSQSISNNPPAREGKNRSNHNGPLKWYNDHERCLRYWAKIRTDCIQCIRICPFNKPLGRLHDFSRLMIGRKIPVLNRLLVSLDRLLGYHRTLSHTRFWGS